MAFAEERDGFSGPEGSWLYTVTIQGLPSFQGIETYSAGGGYSEADQLSFGSGSLASAGHGVWKSTSERKFELTYLNLTFDGVPGNPTGTLKVRQTTTIDKAGNSYKGSGDYAYFDLNGAPMTFPGASGTFTIIATRIKLEAPAK